MHIEPYLMFNGQAEQAIAFYRQALGAELLMMMRMKEAPEKPPEGCMPPGSDDLVMHAALRIGQTQFMLSDGMSRDGPKFEGVTLSISVADEAEARRTFDALAEGGQVNMPLGKTFFSPCFGMVADRFGVSWMVIVPGM